MDRRWMHRFAIVCRTPDQSLRLGVEDIGAHGSFAGEAVHAIRRRSETVYVGSPLGHRRLAE